MKVNALKINVTTADGEYGFSCEFNDGLNIIRGNNSSGKSTLLNSMVYALGMEELLGGKGGKVLPYSLKDYLPIGKEKHPIVNSYVQIEIENNDGRRITLNRTVKSSEKSNKLIEIIDGPYLTGNVINVSPIPTYIHDPGAAKETGVGYFKVLEEFLGLDLPYVPGTSGNEVKLYIQTLFSAFLIEQKRGWTDYIANIPYFRIRNANSKVVEYLLALDVFENDRERNNLNAEISEINQLWQSEKYKIKLVEDNNRLSVDGISIKPIIDFDLELVSVKKVLGEDELSLEEHMGITIGKIEGIELKQKNSYSNISPDIIKRMEETVEEVSRLNSLHESIVSDIQMNKVLLKEYASTKQSVINDLNKNKIAKKLRALGAEYHLEVAVDLCPTCHQNVDDSLLLADTHTQPMSVDENIIYLNKQDKMLQRYMMGIEKLVAKQNRQLNQVQDELSSKKRDLLSVRRDMSSVSELSEVDIRNQLRYEDEVVQLETAEQEISEILIELKRISEIFKENKVRRAGLPSDVLSISDRKKIRHMEKVFKLMSHNFGYKSADANEIIINDDTYLPFLSGLALREINESDADIKADSSASDFVRLIWAYLLSLYDTSEKLNGHHLGMIAFDEPGQHSMADTSVNSLFKIFNKYSGLQSIVAASFDENDTIFQKETDGVSFKLIEVGDKLIKKI